jgi:hypothetical protein
MSTKKHSTLQRESNKPVGDRDHEVLGMGSFGEYYYYTGIIAGVTLPVCNIVAPVTLQVLSPEIVYFGI